MNVRTKIPPNTESDTNHEAELIRRVLEGQADAFSELIKPHFNPLKGLVKKFVRNEFDSDDIVQRTVLKAYARLSQFRFHATFRTWLTSIALNEIRQNVRTVSKARLVFDGGKLIESAKNDRVDSPLEAYERREAAQRLHRAIETLPLSYQTVIKVFGLEENSLSESQATLRISTSAAKTRLFRARRRLGILLSHTSERPAQRRAMKDLA